MIKLYHYSNKDFKGYIRPCFFGNNSFSGNSKQLSEIKRSYFYLSRAGKEYYFERARFLYIAEIPESRLYNLIKDPEKLLTRLNYKSDIYSYFKRKGFRGIIGNNGFKNVILFYPIKIKQKKTLTE